jgi:hypothetical protein
VAAQMVHLALSNNGNHLLPHPRPHSRTFFDNSKKCGTGSNQKADINFGAAILKGKASLEGNKVKAIYFCDEAPESTENL